VVLFASPLTVNKVVVIPTWFTTVVEKEESTDTCRPYDVAPVEDVQLSVGEVETFIAGSAGNTKTGAAGGNKIEIGSENTDSFPCVSRALMA
jgi:hypothetical protein